MTLEEAWAIEKSRLVNEDIASSNLTSSTTPKDSGSVEPAVTPETQNQSAGNDFVGDWRTKADYRASVAGKLCGYWFGWVWVGDISIPTFWTTKGDSANILFNLVQKRRPSEFWDTL